MCTLGIAVVHPVRNLTGSAMAASAKTIDIQRADADARAEDGFGWIAIQHEEDMNFPVFLLD